jgi:hypothetical protein
MANKILIKSKVDATGTPSNSEATIAELAVNTRSGKLFVGTALGIDGTANTNLYTAGKNSAERSWIGAPILDEDDLTSDSATKLATQQSVKAYADLMLPKTGGTMGGHIVVPTGYDVQIADAPGASTDAANKAYVDAAEARAAQGLSVKTNVVAATIAKITLAAAPPSTTTLTVADGEMGYSDSGNTFTQDGVSVATGGRILVKDDMVCNSVDSAKFNGIYTISNPATAGSMTLTRATDMDVDGEFANAFVFVTGGTTNADTGWACTVDEATITVGTTAVTFAQFNSAGTVTAGTNMTKVSNTLNVDDAFLKNSAADVMQVIGAGLTLKDINGTGSATTGGFLKLQMDDGTLMADNHRLGVIEFAGAEDSGGAAGANTQSVGARIEAIARDAWDGTNNDADLAFYTTNGETQSAVLTLDADKLATFGAGITAAGNIDAGSANFVTTGNYTFDTTATTTNIAIVQIAGESFADNDTSLMSSAAIQDKILSYNYGTSSGDLTAIIAGDSLSGTNLDGPIPQINLDPSIALGTDVAGGVLTATDSGTGTNGLAFTIQGSDVSIGGSGDNKLGGAINIIAGHPSGTALGGAIVFKTSPAGATSGTGAGDVASRTVLTLGSDASASFTGDATISGGDITLGAAAVAGTLTLVDSTAGSVGNTFTLTGSDVTTGSGTVNRAGGALVFDAGTGTGTAVSGSITFKTSAAGATSGTSASDAAVTSVTISGAGNFDGAIISGGSF